MQRYQISYIPPPPAHRYSIKNAHYSKNSRNVGETRFGKADAKPMIQRPMTRVGGSDECSDRMFYFDFNKAKVEILDSAEDDLLAASMYGDVKKNQAQQEKI